MRPGVEIDAPLLVTFDVWQVFAAVARAWIRKALLAAGIPQGLLAVLWTAYHNVRCVSTHGAERATLFVVSSGVLQGCPSSGLVWSILSAPPITLLRAVLKRDQGKTCSLR